MTERGNEPFHRLARKNGKAEERFRLFYYGADDGRNCGNLPTAETGGVRGL